MDLDPALSWRDIYGSGFNAHIGPIKFAQAAPDTWIAALAVAAHHTNMGGVCHGGVLLSLADVAMGSATFAAGPEHACATIELDAKFLAAAKEGQTMLAEARQLRRVRDLSFMACRIDAGGRQVLAASGIWKYLSSRAPKGS